MVVYNEVRDKHRGSTLPHLHWNDDTEQDNIWRDPQLKDLSESCPGDDHESDMKMHVRNRLHSPIGSAEAALCNLLMNTARHVIQENDLHQPIARGPPLVFGNGTLTNAVQVLRHVINLGDTGEREMGRV